MTPGDEAHRQQLSSSLTLGYNLMPAAFLATLAWVTWHAIAALQGMGPGALLAPALVLVATLVSWRSTGSLKRVIATRTGLLVSSFRREVFVPYRQIAGARDWGFLGNRVIFVNLRSPIAWGARFAFVPRADTSLDFGSHPEIDLLMQRVAEAEATKEP